jgi:ADP-L-glycero-D-manno-heptose 6-epimerase
MIVVTGAAGFIGSNLVAELNDRGREDLILVDRLGSDSKWRNISKRRFFDFVFPEELEARLAALDGADAVYHLGANSSTTATDADEIVKTNFRVSTQLWNWCVRTRTPLVYASSAATYGNGDQGFDDIESAEHFEKVTPLNLYGWSKHTFDRWVFARKAEGVTPPFWAGLKFFNVYGPNEYHKGDMMSLVAKNAARIAAGERIMLFKSHRPDYADGEQLRDFIYVADCVRAMIWLMESRPSSSLFNLGTGQARSFRDLMLATGKALGKDVALDFRDMPESIRANYQYFTEAKMEKLGRAGFNGPFHSLEEGVADYVTKFLVKDDKYR